MLDATAVCGAVRETTHNECSPVAAWFLRRGDGGVVLRINQEHCQTRGALHAVESWFRLNALVRHRVFGVLMAVEVAATAEMLADLSHAL